MNRLKGKVAVVAGAVLGIRRATTIHMAEEGASFAVLDVLDAQGRGVANELTGASPDCLFLALRCPQRR